MFFCLHLLLTQNLHLICRKHMIRVPLITAKSNMITNHAGKQVKELVLSKPQILIHDGKVEYKTLAKLGITSDELDEAIREHGVENHKNVKLAMFEIDGNISIITGENDLKQTHHKRKIHKTLNEL